MLLQADPPEEKWDHAPQHDEPQQARGEQADAGDAVVQATDDQVPFKAVSLAWVASPSIPLVPAPTISLSRFAGADE